MDPPPAAVHGKGEYGGIKVFEQRIYGRGTGNGSIGYGILAQSGGFSAAGTCVDNMLTDYPTTMVDYYGNFPRILTKKRAFTQAGDEIQLLQQTVCIFTNRRDCMIHQVIADKNSVRDHVQRPDLWLGIKFSDQIYDWSNIVLPSTNGIPQAFTPPYVSFGDVLKHFNMSCDSFIVLLCSLFDSIRLSKVVTVIAFDDSDPDYELWNRWLIVYVFYFLPFSARRALGFETWMTGKADTSGCQLFLVPGRNLQWNGTSYSAVVSAVLSLNLYNAFLFINGNCYHRDGRSIEQETFDKDTGYRRFISPWVFAAVQDFRQITRLNESFWSAFLQVEADPEAGFDQLIIFRSILDGEYKLKSAIGIDRQAEQIRAALGDRGAAALAGVIERDLNTERLRAASALQAGDRSYLKDQIMSLSLLLDQQKYGKAPCDVATGIVSSYLSGFQPDAEFIRPAIRLAQKGKLHFDDETWLRLFEQFTPADIVLLSELCDGRIDKNEPGVFSEAVCSRLVDRLINLLPHSLTLDETIIAVMSRFDGSEYDNRIRQAVANRLNYSLDGYLQHADIILKMLPMDVCGDILKEKLQSCEVPASPIILVQTLTGLLDRYPQTGSILLGLAREKLSDIRVAISEAVTISEMLLKAFDDSALPIAKAMILHSDAYVEDPKDLMRRAGAFCADLRLTVLNQLLTCPRYRAERLLRFICSICADTANIDTSFYESINHFLIGLTPSYELLEDLLNTAATLSDDPHATEIISEAIAQVLSERALNPEEFINLTRAASGVSPAMLCAALKAVHFAAVPDEALISSMITLCEEIPTDSVPILLDRIKAASDGMYLHLHTIKKLLNELACSAGDDKPTWLNSLMENALLPNDDNESVLSLASCLDRAPEQCRDVLTELLIRCIRSIHLSFEDVQKWFETLQQFEDHPRANRVLPVIAECWRLSNNVEALWSLKELTDPAFEPAEDALLKQLKCYLLKDCSELEGFAFLERLLYADERVIRKLFEPALAKTSMSTRDLQKLQQLSDRVSETLPFASQGLILQGGLLIEKCSFEEMIDVIIGELRRELSNTSFHEILCERLFNAAKHDEWSVDAPRMFAGMLYAKSDGESCYDKTINATRTLVKVADILGNFFADANSIQLIHRWIYGHFSVDEVDTLESIDCLLSLRPSPERTKALRAYTNLPLTHFSRVSLTQLLKWLSDEDPVFLEWVCRLAGEIPAIRFEHDRQALYRRLFQIANDPDGGALRESALRALSDIQKHTISDINYQQRYQEWIAEFPDSEAVILSALAGAIVASDCRRNIVRRIFAPVNEIQPDVFNVKLLMLTKWALVLRKISEPSEIDDEYYRALIDYVIKPKRWIHMLKALRENGFDTPDCATLLEQTARRWCEDANLDKLIKCRDYYILKKRPESVWEDQNLGRLEEANKIWRRRFLSPMFNAFYSVPLEDIHTIIPDRRITDKSSLLCQWPVIIRGTPFADMKCEGFVMLCNITAKRLEKRFPMHQKPEFKAITDIFKPFDPASRKFEGCFAKVQNEELANVETIALLSYVLSSDEKKLCDHLPDRIKDFMDVFPANLRPAVKEGMKDALRRTTTVLQGSGEYADRRELIRALDLWSGDVDVINTYAPSLLWESDCENNMRAVVRLLQKWKAEDRHREEELREIIDQTLNRLCKERKSRREIRQKAVDIWNNAMEQNMI